MTGDEELLDELLRLAGAVGVEVRVAADATAAQDVWASAPLVVVGADCSADCVRRGLPLRMGVLLVGGADREDDPALWSAAEALHAEYVLLLPDARGRLASLFAEHGPVATAWASRATTVAVVPGSADSHGRALATALAVTASAQGRTTVLLSTSLPEPTEPVPVPRRGSLALLWLGQAGGGPVAAQVMAAALQAGRAERDLVVLDLPYGLDQATLLALTCADRAILVVAAEVRACAAATKVVAAVRRHCPAVSLVVRVVRPRGLRPTEVAQALDLPLAGVIAAELPQARAGLATPAPLARLSRRLLAELDPPDRPASWTPPVAGAAR